MADPRNFLLNSDYPMDKIIWSREDSVVIPADTDDGFTPQIVIPHGLPFTPLPTLTWSNTSSFTTTYIDQDETYAEDAIEGAMPPNGQFYVITADATNIYIARYCWGVGAKTLYYRIFCFMPSDASSESDIGSTSATGTNFILNTSNNYMKLARAGIFTSSGTVSYTHSLGFVPRVRFWMETGGLVGWYITTQVIESDPSGSGGATSGLRVGASQLEWVNASTSGYTRLHYRIYADE